MKATFIQLLLFGIISILTISSHAQSAMQDIPANANPQWVDTQAESAIPQYVNEPYFGRLDGMLARGFLRVAVTYSKSHYFIEDGKTYGINYETMQAFEAYLRKKYKSKLKGRSFTILFLPMARDQLFLSLKEGRADMAMANLTVTENRKEAADFTIPFFNDVSEIVVASPTAPMISTVEDLSGKDVIVRKSSVFYDHLVELDQKLTMLGRLPVNMILADENLEDEDLLEMVQAGLVDFTVVDDHIANFWKQIFANMQVRSDLVVHSGSTIAWATRKNTPILMTELNQFLKTHGVGTTFGNVLIKRYLKNTYWAKRALDKTEVAKFRNVVDLFKKYGGEYSFDYLMLMAQGYQESQLDHNKRSHVGAIGIMQVMPATGKQLKVGDIHKLDANVHAGSKYMRQIIGSYFSDPAITDTNKMFFAFAAYNCGPNRIQSLRKKTKTLGLDPNQWFGNVENIVARYVSQEPVYYVSNISKYYLAYKLVDKQESDRDKAKSISPNE